MRYILDALITTLANGQANVLAAITRNAGSAPRTTGARMLILQDGSSKGSIGGGGPGRILPGQGYGCLNIICHGRNGYKIGCMNCCPPPTF